MELEQKYKIIAGIQFISTLALVVFWLGYYLLPEFLNNHPLFYSNFPGANPLPDVVIGLILLTAGGLIIKKRKTGIFLSYLSGFILVLLGITGFQLELDSGEYLISMTTMLQSGFVNLWCIIFGLYFLLKLREKKPKIRPRRGHLT